MDKLKISVETEWLDIQDDLALFKIKRGNKTGFVVLKTSYVNQVTDNEIEIIFKTIITNLNGTGDEGPLTKP